MESSTSISFSEFTLGLYDGQRIAIKAWGPEHAEIKVLALHGWLDNSGTWDLLASPLITAMNGRVRFVAMDFTGHGKSSHRPTDSSYFFMERVTEVIGVADALNWKKFVLIGHSMGANAAVLVAGAFTNRIEKLILVDGIGPFRWEQKTAPEVLESFVKQQPKLLRRQRRVYKDFESALDRYCRNNPNIARSSAERIVSRGTVEVLVGGEGEAGEKGYCYSHDPRLTGHSIMPTPHRYVDEFLQRIECPVLFFLANKNIDRYPSLRTLFESRAKKIKNCETVALDAWHHDNPELVCPKIVEFLNKEIVPLAKL